MSRTRSRFTKAERAAAVARYHAGERAAEIAKSLGLSKPAIYLWLAAAKQGARPGMLERIALLESRVAALELLV